MDVFRGLKREPELREPAIWVKRLAVFAKAEAGAQPIRDVALERGVNIVWAREEEEDRGDAPITGHSAGKTTFCRLFRYCLGERTFGTVASTKAIRESFPDGYVAAELRVMGQDWAVRRPIGAGTFSYALREGTIEDLLKKGGKRLPIETYAANLGIDELMERLEGSSLAIGRDEVEWDHILAWCTRDQEARFRNLHEWRSVRSQSETAGFRFKKAGPMLVMRMALGLYERDEITGEEQLVKLQDDRDRQEKELEEAQREPEYLLRHHTAEVRRLVMLELPEITGIEERKLRSDDLEECLERLCQRALARISQRLDETLRATQQAEADRHAEGIEEGRITEQMAQFGVAGAVTGAVGSAENADADALKRLQAVVNGAPLTCPHAMVLLSECLEIQKRLRALEGTATRNAHEAEQAAARRAEVMQRVQLELDASRLRITACQARQQRLKEKIKNLAIAEAADIMRKKELEGALSNALEWETSVNGGGATDRVAKAREALAATDRKQAEVLAVLNRSLRQHDANRELLTRIFSMAVKSVLPATEYDGVVSFVDRALWFSVKRGEIMTGEAVETLSILLADVSCLLFNTLNRRACLPGFLVHDSPREADLGERIYRQFVRFVVAQQRHFACRAECPFQYVLTTTTPPPLEYQAGDEFVKLRLNAAVENDLLLRRNLAAIVGSVGQSEFRF